MQDMTALAPLQADVDPRRVLAGRRDRRARLQRGGAARAEDHGTPHLPRPVLPVPGARHDRRQRQHRRHLQRREPARRRPARRPWPCTCRGKARGYALRSAWSTSQAPVVAYMDVDLSTSLSALLPLVAPLLSGHRDVAIGSRLARRRGGGAWAQARTISRAYNLILKLTLHGRFSDAECGFKALRRDAAQTLLPLVEDNEWFFDTELLVTAERLGLRIGEVPVDGSTIPTRGRTSSRRRPMTCAACGGCSSGDPRACAGSVPTRSPPTSSCASPAWASSPRSGISSSSSCGGP